MEPNTTADSERRSLRSSLADVVEKARAGDRTAFHYLVDRFQQDIYRMIYYRTRSQMDAEDLTQDVFMKAFKNIHRLASPEVFRSWLYRIAVNRVRDHYRRQQVRSIFGFGSTDDDNFEASAETSVAPEAEGGLARRDFWRRVEQMLDRLSRMEREVFTLRFLDQLSIHEIGVTLKKNESTVKTHLYRALNKIKNLAGDLEEFWEGMS